MGRWDLENTMELSTGSMVNKTNSRYLNELSFNTDIFKHVYESNITRKEQNKHNIKEKKNKKRIKVT